MRHRRDGRGSGQVSPSLEAWRGVAGASVVPARTLLSPSLYLTVGTCQYSVARMVHLLPHTNGTLIQAFLTRPDAACGNNTHVFRDLYGWNDLLPAAQPALSGRHLTLTQAVPELARASHVTTIFARAVVD